MATGSGYSTTTRRSSSCRSGNVRTSSSSGTTCSRSTLVRDASMTGTPRPVRAARLVAPPARATGRGRHPVRPTYATPVGSRPVAAKPRLPDTVLGASATTGLFCPLPLGRPNTVRPAVSSPTGATWPCRDEGILYGPALASARPACRRRAPVGRPDRQVPVGLPGPERPFRGGVPPCPSARPYGVAPLPWPAKGLGTPLVRGVARLCSLGPRQTEGLRGRNASAVYTVG